MTNERKIKGQGPNPKAQIPITSRQSPKSSVKRPDSLGLRRAFAAEDFINSDGNRFAFDQPGFSEFRIELLLNLGVRELADEQRPMYIFRQVLQAGSQVHTVADGGVIHAPPGADQSHESFAGVQPN